MGPNLVPPFQGSGRTSNPNPRALPGAVMFLPLRGSTAVTYEITVARSTARGNPARLSIRLGVDHAGGAASTLLAA
jgi:hypothetical protein